MNTKLLKQKILDLAIHGKLVPQNPEDEPASVLLEKIRAEKEDKIRKGEIKRDKKDSHIIVYNGKYCEKFADGSIVDIDKEIPFELPNGWSWTKIKNICEVNPKNKIEDELEVSFIPMDHIEPGLINKFTYEKRIWSDVKSGFTHFAENDIGIAKITPCFENKKSSIFNNLINGYGAGTTELHILRADINLLTKYLFWFIKTDYFIDSGINSFTGAVGQQRIGKDFISESFIPLPPLAEQQRIVEQIEKIFAQIDYIEQNQTDLSTLVKQAKSKILDLAIHGKLAEQNPQEESATVLLEKIRAEKEAKIKAGELKRDKKDSHIIMYNGKHCEKFADGSIVEIEKEIPFELPEGWCWCRLSEICNLKGGKRIPAGRTAISEETSHIYIRVTDMQNETIVDTDLRYITDDIYELIKNYTISKNDLYLTIAGTIGRVGTVPEKFDNMNLTENALKLTDIKIKKEFLVKLLNSEIIQEYFASTYHQVGTPKLSLTNAAKTVIPLPPLAEQQRIVSKIENLFSLLDTIDNQLT